MKHLLPQGLYIGANIAALIGGTCGKKGFGEE